MRTCTQRGESTCARYERTHRDAKARTLDTNIRTEMQKRALDANAQRYQCISCLCHHTLCSFCHLDEMEQAESAVYYLCKRITLCIRNLKQTAEDGDGNVGRTVRLITEDKKRTWISAIKLTFVPSCCQMRLQLLHFHVVCKTWPTFQELTSIVSFRRRRWSQRNFSENRNIQCNQSKDVLSKIRGLGRNIFLAPTLALPSSFA